jgi:hypothetical protein
MELALNPGHRWRKTEPAGRPRYSPTNSCAATHYYAAKKRRIAAFVSSGRSR